MDEQGYSEYFKTWIKNQMHPFLLNSKRKFITNPYVFIDYQEEEDKQKNYKALYMLNIPEITKKMIQKELREIFGNQKINLEV